MSGKASAEARSDILGTLLPGFRGPTLPEWLTALLRDGLGGVCLFATNIESRTQLHELTEAILEANPLALIAIDEEGGDVTRLYSDSGSPYPGNALLGRVDDVDFTSLVSSIVGWELRLAGVNLNLAPDVDINSNPDNPVIGTRSFGATPDLVARHTEAWVRGLQSTGVAASAKHFPGHGDTAQDSHLALPVVDRDLASLHERELVPFVAAIAAGTKTVMSSHILLPRLDAEHPATLSREILHDLLRRGLGFEGVIVTDALDMRGASGDRGIPEAAVLALSAGADLLCIGTDNTEAELSGIVAAIERAMAEGRVNGERVADAAARCRALAEELRTTAASLPIPDYVTGHDEPVFAQSKAIAAFDVRAEPPARVMQPGVAQPLILTLETAANIAVGASPWGLAAAGIPTVAVHEGDAMPVASGSPVVIVGKDNHRREWTRAAIDSVREQHPSTLVIEMGWPSDDRRYADVATFGASRFVGGALAEWLGVVAPAAVSSPDGAA